MGIESASGNTQIEEFLRIVGGSSRDLNVDGSGTPVIFEWEAIEQSHISVLGITVEDELTNDPEKFGVMLALANGVLLRVENDQEETKFALNDGDPIKTNGDWTRMAKTIVRNAFSNKQLSVIYTAALHPFNMQEGDKIIAEIRDDLTPLIGFTICAGGFKYP